MPQNWEKDLKSRLFTGRIFEWKDFMHFDPIYGEISLTFGKYFYTLTFYSADRLL